jgi:ABC-type transport system involved in cytochrome c biogenesis permease component
MLSKIILIREFKLAKYGLSELILSIISCLITTCIFLLILEDQLSDPIIFYGLILVITTSNILINDYISDEFRTGVIEQLFLLPISPFTIVLIKFGFNALKYILVHIILWYLICKIFQVKFYYLQYIVFTLNLMSASLLIMTIAICLPPKQSLISNMLLMPIIFPHIILSILSVYDINYIYLCLSLTIVLMPMFVIFSTIAIANAISTN